MPLILDHEAVTAALEPRALVDALRRTLLDDVQVPDRQHHRLPIPGEDDGTLLLMPAWLRGRYTGIKVASVIPGNRARGKSTVSGAYLLLDGRTGETLMLADADALTRKRTAAVSVLAASLLARPDSRTLLIVGSGNLAPALVEAYAALFDLQSVAIRARRAEAAASVIDACAALGLRVTAAADLEAAVREADIVSCATSSREPLIRGAWLREGTHLDLVGGFTPEMREADDQAVGRANVFVDTITALDEAGDLVAPIASGAWSRRRLRGTLKELVEGVVEGRRNDAAVTLFKSIGTAAADLAAARLLWESRRKIRAV